MHLRVGDWGEGIWLPECWPGWLHLCGWCDGGEPGDGVFRRALPLPTIPCSFLSMSSVLFVKLKYSRKISSLCSTQDQETQNDEWSHDLRTCTSLYNLDKHGVALPLPPACLPTPPPGVTWAVSVLWRGGNVSVTYMHVPFSFTGHNSAAKLDSTLGWFLEYMLPLFLSSQLSPETSICSGFLPIPSESLFLLVGLDHAQGLRTQLLSSDSELLVIRSICSVVFNHLAHWDHPRRK